MKLSQTGVILNTEKYRECVDFYRDLFGLKTLFEKDEGDFHLTCFDLDGSYLMIETGGVAATENHLSETQVVVESGTKSNAVLSKSIAENATKLRFNVPNIDDALQDVLAYGLEAKVETFDWGSVINICDPDGNRVGIRNHAGFLLQVKESVNR